MVAAANTSLPDECRKSGNVWLVTRAAMMRLFGDEP
ncbi:helix-turn-helix domain-containing protein [uncultured Megasphaera sp.]